MAQEMTKNWLLERCKAQGLYRTPDLNDRLYLQCQAFCNIQNLEEYTNVKMLHLDENCLEDLNGVQPLKQLQCLYLRKNFVKSIDHLEELQHLDTLDISENCLTKVDNLSKCFNLRVLMISHNLLDSAASIAHLTDCPSLMVLDLSHNKFKDGDGVLGVAKDIANLTVLYLSGNPFVSKLSHYRKKLLGTLTNLNHLDDRPVFWDERRCAEAWMRGGQEEESAERDRLREIRAAEEIAQFEAMRDLRNQHMEERSNVVPLPLLQFSAAELGEEEVFSPSIELDRISNSIDTEEESTQSIEEDGQVCRAPSEVRSDGVNFSSAEPQEPCLISAKGADCVKPDSLPQQESHSTSEDGACCVKPDPLSSREPCCSSVEGADSEKGDCPQLQEYSSSRNGADCVNLDSLQTQELCWTPSEVGADFVHGESLLPQEHNSQFLFSTSEMGQESEQTFSLPTQQPQQLYTTAIPALVGEGLMQCASLRAGEEDQQCYDMSSNGEADCMHQAPKLETGQKSSSSSGFKNLGSICLPEWDTGSKYVQGISCEDIFSERDSVEHSENIAPALEPSSKQGPQPSPPHELGYDSTEWNSYTESPGACVQQYDDNFLMSLQNMNHIEAKGSPWTKATPFSQATASEQDPETGITHLIY